VLPISQVQSAAELPVQNVEVHLDQHGHNSQTSADISTHNLELQRRVEEQSELERVKQELERLKEELERVKEELKEESSALQEAVKARAKIEDEMQKTREQLEAATKMDIDVKKTKGEQVPLAGSLRTQQVRL